jgi:cobalt/nickel transport system ATP-binding protein
VDGGDVRSVWCVARCLGGGGFVKVLEIDNLRFSYPGGKEVLKGLSLQVDRGERVAVLGPNGAGKTTLLLHLIGILEAGEGHIRVEGIGLEPDTLREVRRRIGLVFQDPDDQLFMPTVREDVAFGPANYGLAGEELHRRVSEALTQVGAEHLATSAPHHLSGGERRRVSLATVLAMQPDILVLDEPSSNLDPAGRRELANVLSSLDTTMLLVTHDLPFALELCQRSIVINHGSVVADGPTHAILTNRELMHENRLELPLGFDPARLDLA